MEFLILFLLAVVNGVLAMSEAAVISARKARLRQQAEAGNASAQAALDLAENPNRFLSTVQIGITLVGIMAGAFGGAAVAENVSAWLNTIPFLAPASEVLGVAIVVAITTYLSLIVGELVPKRLAIESPERIASLIAPPMSVLARFAAPIVWFLSLSTNTVLRLMGIRPSDEPPVTEEEIDVMMQEGTRAGIFDTAERRMVAGVFRLDELRADALMTPRTDMIWLEADDSVDVIRQKINESDYSRYPVCEGSPDHVLGIVRAKDLLRRSLVGGSLDLRTLIRQPVFIPETTPASDILEVFRGKGDQIALVLGEHGGTEGLITVNDIIEAVVGDIEEPEAVQRDDGSWLVDGLMPMEEFEEVLDIRDMHDDDNHLYRTVAGFIITRMGRIPRAADQLAWEHYVFEVVDMDGNRIDKVLVRELPTAELPTAEQLHDLQTQPQDNAVVTTVPLINVSDKLIRRAAPSETLSRPDQPVVEKRPSTDWTWEDDDVTLSKEDLARQPPPRRLPPRNKRTVHKRDEDQRKIRRGDPRNRRTH